VLATLAQVTAYRLIVFFERHTSHKEILCAEKDKAAVGSYSDECKNEKRRRLRGEDGLKKGVMKM
jgi:hypothetical protein